MIDLYQLHRDDRRPFGEFGGAGQAGEGRQGARSGLSISSPRGSAAIAEGRRQGVPIATMQPESNLMNREIKRICAICVRKHLLIPFPGLPAVI